MSRGRPGRPVQPARSALSDAVVRVLLALGYVLFLAVMLGIGVLISWATQPIPYDTAPLPTAPVVTVTAEPVNAEKG